MKLRISTAFFVLFFLTQSTWALEIYQQACRVIGEDDYVQYQIEREDQGSLNLKLTAFEDENCEVPYLQYNQYFQVENLQGNRLNLKTEKITYTALSEEVAEALNLIEYCGINSWSEKSEIGVTGKICDEHQQLAKDEILFQILDVQTSQIRFGKITPQQDGRDERHRPTEWDELAFIRVSAF